MDETAQRMNGFLVRVFNEILRTEENCLAGSAFSDLSLRELHVIEAVGKASACGRNSAAEVARRLRVTAGTLTTSVNLLVKKGYLARSQDAQDRRVKRIGLTDKGQEADRAHAAFHEEMVRAVCGRLTPEEIRVFARGLDSIGRFFEEKYEKGVHMP